ncbi:MAG TPA: hypothetical protein VFV80_02790 [Geminicoccaceae bacterium]|nr:hypothetical protein [Geminicoccaceae bacterium]
MSNRSSMLRIRILTGVLLAAVTLAVLIPRNLDEPDLQSAIVSALAADDRLLEVALEQYPAQGPAIILTYGQLPLFREQLARFGPQVVPIVAAYQQSFTTADALQVAREAWQALRDLLASWYAFVRPLAAPAAGAPVIPAANLPEDQPAAAEDDALGRLSPEERGLIALLNMREEGNAFVGQWEITAAGEARRVPSRVVLLTGPELLIGGLTALERRIVQEQEIDWQTYGLAAVDIAAIASGVALLRFARTAGRGMRATRVAAGTPTLRPGALAAAQVLGINAVRYGLPIGLVGLMVLHPGVFSQYLWVLAESLGMPGIVGPLIGWGIVIVPLAFLLSWMLLSVRLLRFAGRLLGGAAHGCRQLAVRLAVPDRR